MDLGEEEFSTTTISYHVMKEKYPTFLAFVKEAVERHLAPLLEECHVVAHGPALNVLQLRGDPAPIHLHRPQNGHIVAQQVVGKRSRSVKPEKRRIVRR